MYTARGFREFEIGDVDVVKHEGVYHLFHLTLPNHDYIAHAVSEDGLHWQRVKNALFISDPRAWDDDMLWTMQVTADPRHPGAWRMYYTGLCMHEQGRIQRIGLARSTDLYNWEKVNSDCFPLEASKAFYESTLDEGRHWVSFRDPFCFHDNGDIYLLAAARVNHGPIIRRGCVALIKEVAENQFEFMPPIFHPLRYDDIEVPNLMKLDGRYYLIGSIREDIKVHYWYSDTFAGPYQNFFDNVLLPVGNYAARICRDGDCFLVWNFFYKNLNVRGDHLMAPPKELTVDAGGRLRTRSFKQFENLIGNTSGQRDLTPMESVFNNPHASKDTGDASCWFGCESGFEVFVLRGEYRNCIITGDLSMEGSGKCGLVARVDELGDGYYISLDLFKGIAQFRAWRHKPEGGIEEAFHYKQLQVANYMVEKKPPHAIKLIAYEQYLEFSLDGYVLLSLADSQFESGRFGFYAESAKIRIDNLSLSDYGLPQTESYPRGINF